VPSHRTAILGLLGPVLAASLAAAPARADNVADAEDLFHRAKALVAQKKVDEACPLFKESYRLDPAQGTLLNLALCNEQIGKTGTAWGQFRAVEQQARRATPPREDRVKLAKEHADKLEPRLSRVRLDVPPAARAPGLVIKVDGEEKGEPLWQTGIVVDPGLRTIEASAPKKKTATVKVKIEADAAAQTVVLTPLDDLPASGAPGPSGSAGAAPSEDELANNRARRTIGFVVGGVGAATVLAGAAFGVLAIAANSDAKKCGPPCLAGSTDAAASNAATDRALLFANVSNVTLPLGLLAAAIGAYVLLTTGPTEAATLSPRLSRSAAALDLTARW